MDEPPAGAPHAAAEAGPARERPSDGTRSGRPDFDGVVVLCRKCLRRQGLGRRKARRRLKRAYARGRLGRKLRVIETGCLGPCPKRWLTLATPATLARGQVAFLDPALPPEAVHAVLGGAVMPRTRPSSRTGVEADA